MFRSILFLLVLLIVPSANGDELWSVNVERIFSTALAGAYEANPDLVPGDLVSRVPSSVIGTGPGLVVSHAWGSLSIFCTPAKLPTTASSAEEFYQCSAHVSFRIASTTETTVTRQGDRCTEETKSNWISVTVFEDGRVRANKHEPGKKKGSTLKYYECPDSEDVDLHLRLTHFE